MDSSVTFTLAMGCPPAPPKSRSSVGRSEIPTEARGRVSSSRTQEEEPRTQNPCANKARQSRLLQSRATLRPGTLPHNCSGTCSWAEWLSGRLQPGKEVPPAAYHAALLEQQDTRTVLLSRLWRLWRQNPGLQGGEGAWSRSGPQLSNALPQVKGKFKHGGRKALVDKVPRQAALEIRVKNPDEGAHSGVAG